MRAYNQLCCPPIEGRFLTVTRYPKGVEESFFLSKEFTYWRPPEWIQSAMRRDTNYIVAHHLAVWSGWPTLTR